MRGAALLLLIAACGRDLPAERAFVVLEPAGEASVSATPPGVVLEATATAGRLVLTLAVGRAAEVRVVLPGACPLIIPLGQMRSGQTEHRAVAPAFTFQAPAGAVGFDTPVQVTAQPACPEAGPITWRAIAGELRGLRVSEDGRRLTGKTASLLPALPWGVVPVSPRTAGEVTLEARWAGGGRRTIVIAAANRSRGLPNSALGARLLLGGEGWRVVGPPPGGRAQVEPQAGLATLLPDAAGLWRLQDRRGRSLEVHAGRYDETPLDCGRSGCHVEAAAVHSPMTEAFVRLLAARPDDPSCAFGCHTTGDPLVADGGFSDLSRGFGHVPASWESLPRPLRRAGGVGCLACHGPGAIPAPSARWSILRADVCATCHDAPPRYGHVAAWRSSRMAVADADPRARAGTCARCHTTWGFLHGPDRRPPEEAGALGIACAACHAVHQEQALAPGLLRKAEPPFPLPAGTERSGICVSCHAPDAERPFASAAALVLGRGGLDPKTGAPLSLPAPHAALPDGCLGCHAAGAPPKLERGRGHAFRADRDDCRRCHPAEVVRANFAADADLRSSAERLFARLAGPTRPGPHHAGARVDRRTPLGRAAWNLLLVLEDRAAAAHNPVYARALVASAESALPR